MSVAIALNVFAAMGPVSRNGNAPSDRQRRYAALARNTAVVAVPLVLAGVAAAGVRRRSAGRGTSAPAAAGLSAVAARATGKIAPTRAKRHRPKNVVRYYGLSMLISALERDATRKAIITTLKWMQKRS